MLLPSLVQLIENHGTVLYYYDIEASREAVDADYLAILERLDAYLPVDQVTQKPEDADFDPDKKRVVLPHLFFIEQGEMMADLMAYEHPALEEGDDATMLSILEEKYATINED